MGLHIEEDFVKLREHLSELDIDIEKFCINYNFERILSGLGRYPRIRLNKYNEVNLFIDLSMELDEKGNYYEYFFPEIPYRLDIGSWYDEANNRISYGEQIFKGKPFIEISDNIIDIFKSCLPILDKIYGIKWLKKYGRFSKI